MPLLYLMVAQQKAIYYDYNFINVTIVESSFKIRTLFIVLPKPWQNEHAKITKRKRKRDRKNRNATTERLYEFYRNDDLNRLANNRNNLPNLWILIVKNMIKIWPIYEVIAT